jgi:hypothetical protein
MNVVVSSLVMLLAILVVAYTILMYVSKKLNVRLKLSMAHNYRSHCQVFCKYVNFPGSRCIILFIFDKRIVVLMMAIGLHFGGWLLKLTT